jgi:hypothetical protein
MATIELEEAPEARHGSDTTRIEGLELHNQELVSQPGVATDQAQENDASLPMSPSKLSHSNASGNLESVFPSFGTVIH